MKSFLVKYGLVAVALGGFYLYSSFNSDGLSSVDEEIDLNAVLDVTIDTLYSYQESIEGQENDDPDAAMLGFSEVLADSYNTSEPALFKTALGVEPRSDASLLAYEDTNGNRMMDESEAGIFLIEIDGERSRIIASSRSGAVNDHHFSGTGLLTGYLIGSMLSRQRMAGVSSDSLAKKQPVTARAAAKARAGSGSHSKGK
ncbi:hypothetical protein [Teredinibacter haidensis]|uniref:hypothetical protein n=1 Tax=Teredinibacter haidensis TaxID=2731755 RepID=UPI000948BC98|nr:hypothetical protein [Teredinibacter haidensis]